MLRHTSFLPALFTLLVTPAVAQVWTRDASFAPVSRYDAPALANIQAAPAPDGRVLVYGTLTHLNNGAVPSRGLAFLKADGTADTSFQAALGDRERVTSAVPLNDGRVLAVRVTEETSNALVRLTTDGKIDPTFPPITTRYQPRLRRTPDGRVLVFAPYTWLNLNGTDLRSVARLNVDGTLDPTFVSALPADVNNVLAVAGTPDGKVFASLMVPSGPATPAGGTTSVCRLVRLNADGSLDPTFAAVESSARITQLAPQSDGKVVAATDSTLTRYTTNGAVDTSFTPSVTGVHGFNQLELSAAGTIVAEVLVGNSTGAPWPTSVWLLSTTGALIRDLRDTVGSDHVVELLAVESDNTLLVTHGLPIAGYGPIVTLPVATTATVAATLPSNISPSSGAPEPASTGGVTTGQTTQLLPTPIPTTLVANQPALAHVAADGKSATAADPGLIARSSGWISYGRLDQAGRLLVSGSFSAINDVPRPGLARFNANGSLDLTFQPAPREGGYGSISLIGPDGSVLLVDYSYTYLTSGDTLVPYYPAIPHAHKLLADGSEDKAFGLGLDSTPSVNWRAVDAKGRYLVTYFLGDATREENFRLMWLTSEGRGDATLPAKFGGLPKVMVGIATTAPVETATGTQPGITPSPDTYADPFSFLQPLANGQVLAGGHFATVNGIARPWLARINADGSLDTSYQPDLSAFTDEVYTRLDPQGRVIVSGTIWQNGTRTWTLIRLLPDGRRDPTFFYVQSASSASSMTLDNGLPDLNFPRSITNADGTSVNIWGGLLSPDGNVAWIVNPLARLTATDVAKITVPPTDTTVKAERDALLLVGLGTRHPAAYQWLYEGNPIAGATLPYLQLTAVKAGQAGRYAVRVTVDGQTLTSDPAIVTVVGGSVRITNFSARGTISNGSSLVAGFSLAANGAPRTWLLRAMGPTLAKFGVSPTLPDPVLDLYQNSVAIAHDVGGALDAPVVDVSGKVGAFPVMTIGFWTPDWHTKESAIVRTLAAGNYTAHLTSASGTSGSALLEVYDSLPVGASGSLQNLSVRGRISASSGTATLGFVVTGDVPIQVLIRGVGPTLASYGVANVLADPRLSLYGAFSPIATNAGWADDPAIAAAAKQVGAFALTSGSRDAALIARLEPGAYTVQVGSASGATGETLIEVYVVSPK